MKLDYHTQEEGEGEEEGEEEEEEGMAASFDDHGKWFTSLRCQITQRECTC